MKPHVHVLAALWLAMASTMGIAQKLTERLGKPFIVENKVGGSGTIGTQAAASAAPDGLSPEAYDKFIKDETKRWGELARAAGVKPE